MLNSSRLWEINNCSKLGKKILALIIKPQQNVLVSHRFLTFTHKTSDNNGSTNRKNSTGNRTCNRR